MSNKNNYYCIIQLSSNMILSVGTSKQDVVDNLNYLSKSIDESIEDIENDQDLILSQCTKQLHDLALTTDDVDYYQDGNIMRVSL